MFKCKNVIKVLPKNIKQVQENLKLLKKKSKYLSIILKSKIPLSTVLNVSHTIYFYLLFIYFFINSKKS